ncbi:contact-dependent growth inhibition system immunity protein [Pseudomonas sp. BF61]|uniref:contact-dependent growth inhibition system immunity protein n=1 Tax=Pseudomonas sp. BF61 TaxID=2741068 RepID=UPI00209B2B02|nr:contact-dependent growth inhibition system immunity protein [Pseudomonas sp. BF61]
MNQQLTELQQFFGAYFNQDWAEEYSSVEDVIDSLLKDSSRDVITTAKQEILELINSYTNELDLQKLTPRVALLLLLPTPVETRTIVTKPYIQQA